MPRDPLIPNANGTPSGAPQAENAPSGFSTEALQKLVADAIAPIQQTHQAQMGELRAQNEALRSEMHSVRQASEFRGGESYSPQDPFAGMDSNTVFSQMMEDPSKIIGAIVEAKLGPALQQFQGNFSNQVAPILDQFNRLGDSNLRSQYRERLDAEFGKGTFQEKFEPLINLRIQQASRNGNPLAASDTSFMEAEVRAIKGELFDELTERRANHVKAVAEGRETETADLVNRVTTNIGPGGFPTKFFDDRATEPTPEQQAFLDRRNAADPYGGKGAPTFDAMRKVGSIENLDQYREQMASDGKVTH